jgi:uncharacterized membrane protein
MGFKLRGLRDGRDAAGLFATTIVMCVGFTFCMGLAIFVSPAPEFFVPLVIGVFLVIALLIMSLRNTREASVSELELIQRVYGKKVVHKEHTYRFGKIVHKDQQQPPAPPSAEKIRDMKEANAGWGLRKSTPNKSDDAQSELI